MPPQVTQAWGTAYFQVLVTLLVFAFGVPALALQFTIPEEIREILYRHTPAQRVVFLIAFILSVLLCGLSITFVWGIHPCIGPIPSWKEWLAGFFVSVALLAAVVSWWLAILTLSRARLVRIVERKVARALGGSGPGGGLLSSLHDVLRPVALLLVLSLRPLPGRRDGDETLLFCDYITLGERSPKGFRKQVVLDSVARVFRRIVDSAAYSGHELLPVMRLLPRIIVSPGSEGSEENFESACRFLRGTLHAIRNKEFEDREDGIALNRCATEVGVAAVRLGFEDATEASIALLRRNPLGLFALGREALRRGAQHVAAAALDVLQRPLGTSAADCEDVIFFLGLLSCLAVGGSQTQRRAVETARHFESRFKPSLNECLKATAGRFYEEAEFDVAEAAMNLLDALDLP